jgi:hypothetical protein
MGLGVGVGGSVVVWAGEAEVAVGGGVVVVVVVVRLGGLGLLEGEGTPGFEGGVGLVRFVGHGVV